MRDRILDAAARLIQERGLRGFTMDDLAAELGASKKTIYRFFSSKDEIIRFYFHVALDSDAESVRETLSGNGTPLDKVQSIIHSGHRYRLSPELLAEARRLYPNVGDEVEKLKRLKTDSIEGLLEQAAREGLLREDLNVVVATRMLDALADMFTDYDFLLENGLTARGALDAALSVMLHGIAR